MANILHYRMTRFDFEGMLFVNFPVEAWVSGAAEKAVEATAVEMMGEDAYLDWATTYAAIVSLANAPLKAATPSAVEALRLETLPETASRFAPYWSANGGQHVPGEVSGWDFDGEETDATDGWAFGDETEQIGAKARQHATDGWNF